MYAHFELKDETLGIDEELEPMPGFVMRTQSKRRIQVWGNEGHWKIEMEDDDGADIKATIVRRSGRVADIELKAGPSEGTAVLHAWHGARMSTRILVRAVDPNVVKVNFHFFTSGPSKTTLTRSQVVKLLDDINKIYEPQSFIKFHIHLMDPIRDDGLYAIDFATTKQSTAANQAIFNKLGTYLKDNFPAKMHRHVFCVRKFGARDRWVCKNGNCTWRDVTGVANKIGGNFVIIDGSYAGGNLVQLLAHELGHSLRLPHDKVHSKNLMTPSMDPEAVHIGHEQLDRMYTVF